MKSKSNLKGKNKSLYYLKFWILNLDEIQISSSWEKQILLLAKVLDFKSSCNRNPILREKNKSLY
jgi:hypothetical protein